MACNPGWHIYWYWQQGDNAWFCVIIFFHDMWCALLLPTNSKAEELYTLLNDYISGNWTDHFVFLYAWIAEKAMAPHSITLAWKIPWMEKPGRLQSMGWLRVRHDRATSLSLSTFMHWRRKWQPTPVFFPGESQGPRNLVGCHLWGRTESDMTEATQQQQHAWI